MEDANVPTLTIQLGISVKSMPTFEELFKRAKSQFSLVAAGSESLAYLNNATSILSARLDVNNGNFELTTQIPVRPQADLFGHANQARRQRGLDRNDFAEQLATDETIAAVEKSSNLLDRVAYAMNNLANLKEFLQNIERREGVFTRPARRYIQSKQADFLVEVEDESITFNAHPVRGAVAHPDSFNINITLSNIRDHNLLSRGLITYINNDSDTSIVKLGSTNEFRFTHLEDWQRSIIEAARWLNIPIQIVAVKTISTCTLNNLPIEVQEVVNWDELMVATIEAFLEIQKDINVIGIPVQRDAA